MLAPLDHELTLTKGRSMRQQSRRRFLQGSLALAGLSLGSGCGVVPNIAHPEGNITGLNPIVPAIAAKWVQLLHEAVPTIGRLATISDPSSLPIGRFRNEVARAAQLLQLEPAVHYDLRDQNQLSTVLSTVKAAGADGLVVLSGGVLGGANDPRIGREILSTRLPAIADQWGFAAAGGLLAYGPVREWGIRRSASYVDKILKGAKPADLPIETPTQFDLFVNLRTAQELGLTVPQSVLDQATEVIQ